MATARKLSCKRDRRQLLHRNLLTSLVLNGHIVTTEAKAKSIKPWAEKLIGWGRSKNLADQRLAASYLTTQAAMVTLLERVKTIPNVTGAIRLIRTAPRKGDNAPQTAVIIRQVTPKVEAPAPKAKTAAKKPTKTTAVKEATS
jgi:large subunit ribosomal protein L17